MKSVAVNLNGIEFRSCRKETGQMEIGVVRGQVGRMEEECVFGR